MRLTVARGLVQAKFRVKSAERTGDFLLRAIVNCYSKNGTTVTTQSRRRVKLVEKQMQD